MIFSLPLFVIFIIIIIFLETLPGLLCYLPSPKFNIKKDYKPKISILLPSRNEDIIIKKTLETWLNVDYPKDKIEILCIDDSDDGKTPAIIKSFAKRYKCVKYVNGEGVNKIAALEKGIKVAKHPVISISDSDLFVDKDCLKELVPYIADKRIGAVFGTRMPKYKKLFQMWEGIRLLYIFVKQKFYTTIDSAPFAHMNPSLFRKKDLARIKLDRNLVADDFFIGIELRKMGLKSVFLPHVKGSYAGTISNLKEMFIRDIRTFKGTLQISFKGYCHTMFRSKYGVFGMFSVPFRQLYKVGRPLLFGALVLILLIEGLFGKLTIDYLASLALIYYFTILITSLIDLIAIFITLRFFELKMLLLHPLYPFFLFSREISIALSVYIYISGKKIKWKKTQSDRIV